MPRPARSSGQLRNFVFGVEDSLVSTVGLLAGVASAGLSQPAIIASGVVLIFVEAFSMGVGSLLSDNSAREYESGREVPLRRSLAGGATMLVSYFVAGFVPLFPYLIFPVAQAFSWSICFSLVALFALGLLSGRLSRTSKLKQGLEMFLLGGAAVLLGVAVGRWFN